MPSVVTLGPQRWGFIQRERLRDYYTASAGGGEGGGGTSCLVTRLGQVMPWEVAPSRQALSPGPNSQLYRSGRNCHYGSIWLPYLMYYLGRRHPGSLACCLGGMPEGNTWLAGLPGEAREGQPTELCAPRAPVGAAQQVGPCLHFCYFVNHGACLLPVFVTL